MQDNISKNPFNSMTKTHSKSPFKDKLIRHN